MYVLTAQLPFGNAHQSNSTHRYLSIMIGRLMLSLKKAAEASTGWSVASIAHTSNLGGHPSKRSTGMEFAPMSEEGTVSSAEEDISLRVVSPPMP